MTLSEIILKSITILYENECVKNLGLYYLEKKKVRDIWI